ncbi:MAG: hypothetical protein GF315_05835 [candidate division Zixibacteria bacterium]|nr:hypothetical protein [candidate division Zixibacteria bacterium]
MYCPADGGDKHADGYKTCLSLRLRLQAKHVILPETESLPVFAPLTAGRMRPSGGGIEYGVPDEIGMILAFCCGTRWFGA